jgi:hypothetical protein
MDVNVEGQAVSAVPPGYILVAFHVRNWRFHRNGNPRALRDRNNSKFGQLYQLIRIHKWLPQKFGVFLLFPLDDGLGYSMNENGEYEFTAMICNNRCYSFVFLQLANRKN